MSVYDDAVSTVLNKQQTDNLPAALSMAVNSQVSPDQEAEYQRLSKASGVPVGMIRSGADNSARLKMAQDTAAVLPGIAPATARFLSDPQNAQVAHDDVDSLSAMEQVFKPFLGAAANVMGGAARAGELGNRLIDLGQAASKKLGFGRSALFDRITSGSREDIKQAETYWQALAQRYGVDPRSIPGQIYTGIGATPEGILDWSLGVPYAAAKGAMDNGLTGAITEGTKRAALGQIFHALGNIGLGPVGRAGAMGGIMGVQSLAEGQGLDAAVASAVTGAALGLVGMTGEQETVRRNLIQSGVDPEQATQLAALTHSVSPLVREATEAKEAQLTKDMFSALGDTAAGSKLLQRLPEKMREFVTELKQGGPVDNVYIPADRWETLWQDAKDDPADVAERVTGDRQQYLEALATGGDVVIPLEDFISHLAGSEYMKSLVDDLRLRPGAMTAREAAEFEKQYPDKVQELRDQIAAEESTKERAPWLKVYDDVYGQLSGIYPRDTAEKYATLAAIRARPDAPEQLKADWQTIGKWLGIDGDTSREQHEQFARAAESYLMEGKAPKLTDDVRQVFDRLLATDEEIANAQSEVGHKPLFATAEDAGMTAKEFEAYKKDAEAGGQKARDVLSGKLMKELQREHTTWWKAEKEKVRAEVMDDIKQNPVYSALQEIIKGKDFDGNETPGLKMDRAALVDMYGEEFLKRLPKGSATEYAYTSEGGIHPDLLAERYGFSSGDEMIRKMIEAPKMTRFLAAETDLRMRERHGDMRLDGSIADEALKAVHNDHWAEVMRAEIKALRKKAKDVKPYVDAAVKEANKQAKADASMTQRWYDAERKTDADRIRESRRAMQDSIPPVKTFREAAAQQIGAKPVKEISPQLYLAAERKAARESFDAAAKGDFDTAADARTRQMLNHFLYFEAVKAREEADKIQKYAVKMGTATELGKLGKAGQAYLDQVKAILNRYEFVKVSLAELELRKETLQQFLDRLKNEDGLDLPIPPEIVDEMQRPPNYRELTMDELRSVYDSVRMIDHAAQVVNSAMKDAHRVLMGEAAAELVDRLQISIPERSRGSANDSTLSFLEKIKEHAGEIDIPVIRPEFLFERMDGNKTRGAWHDFFWNRYNDAANFQNRLREMVFPEILEITRGKGIDRSERKIFIKGLDGSLSKDDIIAIALNSGNESNLEKMMQGGVRFRRDEVAKEVTHETLQEILSHLNPDEIKIVNGIWRAIEKLKPEAAKLAVKRTGIEPTWIEAQPMEIANGTLDGGYFPMRYDPRWSHAGEKQADASTIDQMFTRYAPTSTRQGYMKERTDFSAPVSLDWKSVTTRHLDEVITDISHWEFASQAQRLLKRGDVKSTIIDRLGEPYYKNLLDWVRYTVNQDTMGRESSDTLEKLRRAVRTKASTYILGFKVTNAIADMLIAAPLAVQRLDTINVFKGSMEYLRNPLSVHRFASASSEYMRHLDLEIDRNLTEALNDLAGKKTMLDDVRRWSLESRMWAYKIAANAAWISGYREAQSKGMDGIEAVRYADKIPRMTQDAGRAGDLSAVERNPNMRELTMYIGPTLIQYNNTAEAVRRFSDSGFTSGNMANAAKVLMFGYIANTVVYELLRGRNPDDNEKLPAWLAARLGLGIFDGIPIARDIAAYAEGKITGEPGKTMRNIPVMEAGKQSVDAMQALIKAGTGEGTPRKAVTTSAKAIGAWSGLPALQGTITGEFLYDVLSGNYEPEHPWSPARDIFMRRKERR